MYRILMGTALLATSLAFAQQAPATPAQTSPKTKGAETDRSTAKTMGESNRAMMQSNDKKFVMDAATGGMAEVQLGQLAVEKATNPDVKAFGQKMVEDHGKANDELKSVASANSIDLPTSLDAKHQATVDRLSKLSGAEFDRAYVKEMVKDHDMDVKEFQKASQSGMNSAVRDFASKTLPTLQEHQTMIHDIDKNKMSGKATSADRSKQQ